MKALVIEDEVKLNKSLTKGLAHEGFLVSSAFDGEDGLEQADNETYDIIILDIMMPRKDGIEVLETLRSEENYTPVIMLTARDTVDDRIKGLLSGADDYLPKPFSFDELLARIKAIVRRATSNQTTLQADTLSLDPYTHTVMRAGEKILLSSKEFQLLELLLKHKGMPVSEDKIIMYVWDYNYEGTSNIVAAHIKNLRNKIDRAFPKEKPIIQTMRGFGYKIDG